MITCGDLGRVLSTKVAILVFAPPPFTELFDDAVLIGNLTLAILIPMKGLPTLDLLPELEAAVVDTVVLMGRNVTGFVVEVADFPDTDCKPGALLLLR